MTLETRLSALDDRVVPVIAKPLRTFVTRHPVAARRAPLISIILLLVAAALDLFIGGMDNSSAVTLFILLVALMPAGGRGRASRSTGMKRSG